MKPLGRSTFETNRNQYYDLLRPIFERHLVNIQYLVRFLGDNDFLTDGTHSHKRNAQWGIAVLMSRVLYLIVGFEVANQKIDRIKASELEPFATRVMLEKILADGILKLETVTHDEHSAVTKILEDKKIKQKFDPWHKHKNIDSFFRKLVPFGKLEENEIKKTVGGLSYYFLEFQRQAGGNSPLFKKLWESLPSKFNSYSIYEPTIKKFSELFIPKNNYDRYCNTILSSPVESFNSFHHETYPKNKFFPKYYDCRAFHSMIKWNISELRRLGIHGMPGIYCNETEFVRDWQSAAKLLLTPLESTSTSTSIHIHIHNILFLLLPFLSIRIQAQT